MPRSLRSGHSIVATDFVGLNFGYPVKSAIAEAFSMRFEG
jgi:hypothetical protein